MGMAESLTFGALISAVDPVATLAIFGVLKVEPNLNYRVFGESLINDAVSIVLFRVFGHFIVQEVTTWEVFKAIFTFLKISLGSLFLGVGVAILASLVMKVAHIHDPLLAAGTFIIWSYISYEVVEALHLSGIIASLFCGFGMSHYALKNIAEQYHEMVHDMVHMMACMADLGIFFSVGVNVVLMAPYDKWMFIAVSMGLCLVGRMCNIFPLCGLYNICPGPPGAFKWP
jgi:NhaP-type Na+/H+ or K+/H+ antiporter